MSVSTARNSFFPTTAIPAVKNFAINPNAARQARQKAGANGFKNKKIAIILKGRLMWNGSGNGEKITLVTGVARNLVTKMRYKIPALRMTIKNS